MSDYEHCSSPSRAATADPSCRIPPRSRCPTIRPQQQCRWQLQRDAGRDRAPSSDLPGVERQRDRAFLHPCSALRLFPCGRTASQLYRGALRPLQMDLRAAGRYFARRHDGLSIASMRLHLSSPTAVAATRPRTRAGRRTTSGAIRFDRSARRLSAEPRRSFSGHEVFYIVAPDTTEDTPSQDLAVRYFPHVPVRGGLSGHRSFFTSRKAETMLGWKHPARGVDHVGSSR